MTFFSCSKNAEKSTSQTESSLKITADASDFSEPDNSDEDTVEKYYVELGKISEGAFGLDYTPLEPEAKKPAGKINMSAGTSSGQGAGNPDGSVIPGLRSLDAYQTAYYKDKVATEDIVQKTDGAKLDKSKAPKEDFTIIGWGPEGTIPSDVKCPSFYVQFSEPVVAVKALDAPMTSSEYMKITPPLKGVFRWYGTSLLSFDSSEAADPMQSYTITVSKNVTSIYGKKLVGNTVFSTEAESLKIRNGRPGEKYSAAQRTWFPDNDVPFEAAGECTLTFNYDVKADQIQKLSTAYYKGKEVPFTVSQKTNNSVFYNLTLPKPVETAANIQISVKQPVGVKGNAVSYSYKTLSPFTVSNMYAEETTNSYSNPVYIYFSHPLKAESVLGSLSTTPKMAITKDNLKIDGRRVILYNLDVTFGSQYTVHIDDSVTDIYGRKLSMKSGYEKKITVLDAASEVNYKNSGTKILEASFPHKLVFDYQNLRSNSYYKISKTRTPLNYEYKNTEDEITKDMKLEPVNQRIMEVVDFDPLLNNGKGWVQFSAVANIWGRHSGSTYERKNNVNIQITDLGVTVRYGVNKLVAMVTRLSDGKPVEGATVYVTEMNRNARTVPVETLKEKEGIPKGISDSNGLVVIPLDIAYPFSPVAVLVETEDDAVIFEPSSHSPWRNGIYNTESHYTAARSKQVTFMFSDRGLYKPGETVSFRGIDRNLCLGQYTPFVGKYQIEITEDSWYRPKVIKSFNGTTSESGGFYGSFELPSDLEPGSYKISYKRTGKGDTKNVTFTVAYFERLKFQAGISLPQVPVTIGDTLQATLSASYLAGGALSGADYSASWIRESWYFESEDPAFKGCRFGPMDSYSGRTYISDDSGTLSANGEAKLTVTASAGDLKGVPYRFRVSANVTDASNMSISTQGAAIVHPALYYVGLTKPAGTTAYPKAGQKLEIMYKLSDLQGVPVQKAKDPKKLVKLLAGDNTSLKVTLSREAWNLVQQNGIYGDVYSRYEKTMEAEETKTISLDAEGKISVTPKKCGYYVLTVEGKDAKGRDVLSERRFFVTGKGSYAWNQDDATSIRLTPDQSKYNPGEMAHILMESTLPAGDYLITVEREGIFTEEIKHFDDSVSVIDIPVARNYVPVVYVSVSSYSVRNGQPTHKYGEVDLDKPKGYYGVTEVFVDPYVKAFSLDVKSEKTAYRPGEEATITLTATRGGEPLANAELTLLAVDRGVLDLINYHVPNPIDFFYNTSIFPLCVKGGDNRAYLMDPVTYEVKNLQGGDEGEGGDKMQERSDFNPTAVFEPVLITDEKGQVTCKFKLPDTLTTYRVTAFGVYDDMLALQEDEIGVQNPVNVQQVMPRRLRERDTGELGVLLTNLDNVAHDITVKVSVQTPDGKDIPAVKGLADLPGSAFVDGPDSHTVTVYPGQNTTVYFDVSATKAGTVNTVFEIKSDIINERIVCPLKIENPYLFETFTSMGAIRHEDTEGHEALELPQAVDNNGTLELTLDATRLGTLGESVRYVFGYPYGCMEQQSARVLPLIIFEEYIDVFGLHKDARITDVRSLVKSYLKDWSASQIPGGALPYWPKQSKADTYVSLRIAHICALAKERGYTDSEIAIDVDRLMKYLEVETRKAWASEYEKAMNNYVRAMMGLPVSATDLEAQFAKNTDLSIIALTGLTAIKIPSMGSELADKCEKRIRSYLRPGTRGVDLTNESRGYYCWYNGNTDRMALALQFLVQMNKDDDMVTRLIWSLLQEQKAGYWTSTATTARVLDAMYTVIKTSGLDDLNLKAKASINGTELVSGSFAGPAAKPVTETLNFSDPKIADIQKNKTVALDFEKQGNGSLYYTTSLKYAVPYENLEGRDEGISVVMKLTDSVTGEEIKPKAGTTVVELESGKTYSVSLTVSSNRTREYLALRAPIPSGAEILDSTFVTTAESVDEDAKKQQRRYDEDYYDDWYYGYGHWMSNQVIYDNEIHFFWDYFGKGNTTANFKFRAVRRGVYPVPPANAECMYEPEVFGRADGYLYTIK